MHLSLKTSTTLEVDDGPVNPDQSPADIVVLSFTDSDLACMAKAYAGKGPSLCLTSLARLKHPLSVDLYIEQVASHAKVILVRLLGGYDWWPYGCEELARMARERNIAMIMVPGSDHADERLTALSTVPAEMVAAVDACFAHGGMENISAALRVLHALAKGEAAVPPVSVPVANGALYAMREGEMGRAIIIFYRAHYLAADVAPIDALSDSLAAHGLNVRAFMVKSLKDEQALAALRDDLQSSPPDIILDLTAFSAGDGAHPLEDCNVPILQCALANSAQEAWEQSGRGLSTTDLAMHVVLPEADGRVFTRAISFKAKAENDTVMHQPRPDRVQYVAELTANWVKLAKKAKHERKLALILSDYPGRSGRCAFAVGLDAPQSILEILRLLENEGYQISSLRGAEGDVAIHPINSGLLRFARNDEMYSLTSYQRHFNSLPLPNQQALLQAWGRPEEDSCFKSGAFHLPCQQFGNVIAALQPDRGSRLDKRSSYHDTTLPPRHGYLAFYWWLRDRGIDALIHLGTHGNLEWLPGKSVALSSQCWPEIALGPVPVVYPYIVSDPGEAAQAKRRISAVTLSHMTPPLVPVSLTSELAELEALVDEFSAADGLDARRMKLLREEILHRARRCGMPGEDDNALMTALEAHLCDIKEQRVGDGLHVFCQAGHEAENLLKALDGGFIPPGPGGSPARGCMDILPTGRNLITIDPRKIPTATATAIGRRSAEEFIRRYAQDHGDYPKSVMMDVWGAQALRNGGDEIAHALILMGVNPVWDKHSGRVTGFEVIPEGQLPWPRVDVTLRVSGLFRDMFAHVITLFDDAVKAIHPDRVRIFGNAPGAYGAGVTELLDSGLWAHRNELGQAYMQASHFAYGRHADGEAQPELLKERIATADAFVHVQDQREMDVLSGADFADAEGGFAAAASALGSEPSLYHLDTSRPQAIRVRTLAEEVSLVLHSRVSGREWIAGQMRHGYAGAAAMADAVDQLFAFAAASDAVASEQFDLLFDAYLHDERIREFIARENPDALDAMKKRFEEAVRRGLWNPLRNSVWMILEKPPTEAAA